ncbi:hypothetical protein E5D57_002441 [Metarhizium anisopliae]|nr:hypothetical protein E5D57_002441 [Metarhizium anisopliae]
MGNAAQGSSSRPVRGAGEDVDAAVQQAGLELYTNALDLASDFGTYMSSLGRTRQLAFVAGLESETAAGAALYRSFFEERREQLEQCARERERRKEACERRRALRVSGDFVLGRIWALIDDVDGFYGREEERRWVERLERANREIEKVWEENRSAVEGAVPRYLEGIPVRMMIRPPVARGPLRNAAGRGERGKPGLICLQCMAKGLRCSLGGGAVRACSRCVRHGDACLVNEGGWVVLGEDGKLEDAAEDDISAASLEEERGMVSACLRDVVSVGTACFAPRRPSEREMESVLGRILGVRGLEEWTGRNVC